MFDTVLKIISILSSFLATTVVGYFGYLQFKIKRDDERADKKEEKEEKAEEKKFRIDERFNSIELTMQKVFKECDEIGKLRFEENKKSIEEQKKQFESQQLQLQYMCDLDIASTHDKLYHRGGQYIKRGCITADEKAILHEIYVPYSKLGGNGTGKERHDACMLLPVVDKEIAYYCDSHDMSYIEFMKEVDNGLRI